MNSHRGQWIALKARVSSKTLELADSLKEAGYEVWSPREAKAGDEEKAKAMIPYVFATADKLHELLALSHSPTLNYLIWDSEKRRMVSKGHPYFNLVRQMSNEIALIPDRQLAALRLIERRRKPRGIVKEVALGAIVRMSEGGFAGLIGKVEEVLAKHVQVAFAGFPMLIKVPKWLVQEALDESCASNVCGTQTATAA